MSDSENNSTVEEMLSSLKSLDTGDLFKVLKQALSEAEKQSKQMKKSSAKETTTKKKTGSMPKGVVPKQLMKPRAWVEYTLKDAHTNGWESFTVVQVTKDKTTGTKTEEQIEMPKSILHNGSHVFEGSVTEEHPDGKQLIHKDAMSLSKQRKMNGHGSWTAFEAEYVDESSEDEKSVTSNSSSKIVVKKTAAEKEAEAAAKKAAKEAEKEAKKAEKEAEKAAKKAEKEVKKPKDTTKPVETVTTVPAKKKPVAKVEEIPNDGMVHPWTYNNKKYLRNADGETWSVGADGGCGGWVGLYDSKTDKIDTSATEPVFEDDE